MQLSRLESLRFAKRMAPLDPMVLSAGRNGPNGLNAHNKIELT
jgi:hypothetical protein